jgi:hypothetical protein
VQIQHQPALRRAKRSDFQLELTIADKDDSPGFVCNKQLLVTEVEEDMEAERCGVCKGMRLVGFGGRRFTSREFVWGNARKIRWKHVKDMSRKIQLPHTYMFDSRMADVLEVPRHGLHVRGYGYVVIDQAEPVDVLNALRRHLTQLGVRPCDKRRVAKCFGAHRHRDIRLTASSHSSHISRLSRCKQLQGGVHCVHCVHCVHNCAEPDCPRCMSAVQSNALSTTKRTLPAVPSRPKVSRPAVLRCIWSSADATICIPRSSECRGVCSL